MAEDSLTIWSGNHIGDKIKMFIYDIFINVMKSKQ